MNEIEIINIWNRKDELEQYEMLKANVLKAVQVFNANGLEMEELINEAWLRVVDLLDVDKLTKYNECRAARGQAPITLLGICFKAARNAIRHEAHAADKHGVASALTMEDSDGNELDYLDTVASGEDLEETAVTNTLVSDFVKERDSVDQVIISGLLDGLTEREIGKIAGISGPAVHKRIVKIRAALSVAIA